MSDEMREIRDGLHGEQAAMDQLLAQLRDDDELAEGAVALTEALSTWMRLCADRGWRRPHAYSFAIGVLLAALDHILPATAVAGQPDTNPKEET